MLKYIFLIFLTLSCSNNSAHREYTYHLLAVKDSLGSFSGPVTFGNIGSSCILTDDRIAVYDRSLNEIALFYSDGTCQINKNLSGEGPGEFQTVSGLIPSSNGGIWIQGGSIEKKTALFNNTMDMIDEIIVKNSRIGLLTKLTYVSDSTYIGYCYIGSQHPDSAEHSVYRFSRDGSIEELIRGTTVYQNTPIIRGHKYIYTESNKTIYIAYVEGQEYIIEHMTEQGDIINTIMLTDRSLEARPEWLIQNEIDYIEEVYTRSTGNTVSFDITVPEYFSMIDYMGVDGEGRLWALRGNYLEPIFDVFDQDGNLEFICGVELPDWQECDRWRFYVGPGGFLAYQENPEMYPLVYRIELLELDASQ
jgi:hypothetical protein